MEFKDHWSNFVIHYLKVLKLFPVACRYGWHGFKWIETLKKLAKLLKFRVLMLRVPKILRKFIMFSPF